MKDDMPFMTREQYIDLLIDASFREAAELKSGFMDWCEQHGTILLDWR